MVAAAVVAMPACTKSVSSVVEATKRAESGFVGRISLTGYCRADHQVDWLYDNPTAHQWESRPIALDVSSLVSGISTELRREARIRMMLKFEGMRVAVKGVLKKGLLEPMQKIAAFVAVEEIKELDQPPDAIVPWRLPTSCPYGHSALKHVKIVYGGPLPPPDAKTREALNSHEIVFAGTDVFGPGSPQWTVFCTRCGFIFERGSGPWAREAEDPATFVQPFSSLLRDFQKPEAARRTLTRYTQDLRDGLVSGERLFFITTEPLATLKDQVVKWANLHGVTLSPPKLPEEAAYRLYPTGKLLTEQYQYWGQEPNAAVSGHVGFIAYPGEGTVHVDLLIGLNRPAKTSIDEALRKSGQ